MGIFSKGAIKDGNQSNPKPELLPPDILTTANLTDLEKVLAHNVLITKLCTAALSSTKLPDLKKAIETVRASHLKQTSDLLGFLKREKENAE
ncbi:hypothetical protein [Bhargavaea cecembensis]|uniref:hypothetical protein n=1 Tax=Bhargavaea cecembensis TaxID=394098 RepID=UPI00058B5717|nr:hypothetical protein [Bhargavaea cecembensis]